MPRARWSTEGLDRVIASSERFEEPLLKVLAACKQYYQLGAELLLRLEDR